MITIQQRINKKIPGGTSLFIQFDYNPKIIDIIKTTRYYSYDKKTHEWEVPLTSLATLLDELCCVDDVQLEVLPEEASTSRTPVLQQQYKLPPFDYQLEGIQYGLNHHNWLLLDEPGLGKTLQVIYLAEELRAQEGLEHCLIICGINTLKANWKKEINKCSNLGCCILGEKVNSAGRVTYGSVAERCLQLKNPIKEFFIVVNIETLRSSDFIEAFKLSENKIDFVVFDEIHKVKSSTSQQSHGLLKLPKVKYQLGLTGTLIMNNPLDCYLPLKWLDVEHCSLTKFKEFYCEFGGPFHNILYSFKNTSLLKDLISTCSLRRKKELLQLPPKLIVEEALEMSESQQQFYDEIKQGISSNVDRVHLTTTSLLALVTRLRQATACPSILTTNAVESVKIQRACELVEEITSNNHKIVIFSAFKEPLNVLYQLLGSYNPLLCTGDVADDVIAQNIDKFQKDPTYKVILCTHSKMGTGVTLTAATYEIFIDSCWTARLEQQCEDRCYRVGTQNTVTVYKLICQNTIDERVNDIIKTKEALSSYMIDNQISDTSIEQLRKYILDL